AIEPHLAQDDDDRVEHHLVWNEGAEEQDGKEGFRALEPPVGERIAADRRHRDGKGDRWQQYLYRVPEASAEAVAVEPCAGLRPSLYPGFERDFQRWGEDVAHPDLRHALQRGDDHHVERQQIIDRGNDERAVEEDVAPRDFPPRLRPARAGGYARCRRRSRLS